MSIVAQSPHNSVDEFIGSSITLNLPNGEVVQAFFRGMIGPLTVWHIPALGKHFIPETGTWMPAEYGGKE